MTSLHALGAFTLTLGAWSEGECIAGVLEVDGDHVMSQQAKPQMIARELIV